MPYDRNADLEYVSTQYYYHSSVGGTIETQGNFYETGYTYKQFNDTISRVKPDDLAFNLTNLPLQYTMEVDYLVTEPWQFSSGWCYEHGWRQCWRLGYEQRVATFGPNTNSNVATARNAWPDWATDLRLKVKDDVINLGATVAEYKQSARMFGSAARGVLNAWRAFRRGKISKKWTTCDISAAHLIYDYGVAPLMSDMYDSIETLRLRLEQPLFKRYFFKQKLPHYECDASLNLLSGISDGVRHTVVDGSQYIAANVKLDPEKASRFTLGNPAEITWEIVPFSFVIDWFIPVGDFLIALDALMAVDEISVSISRKVVQTDTWTGTMPNDYNGNRVGIKQQPHSHYVTHERIATSTVPLPSLPKFDLNATVNMLLNATSLLHVVRGCKGRPPRFARADFGR